MTNKQNPHFTAQKNLIQTKAKRQRFSPKPATVPKYTLSQTLSLRVPAALPSEIITKETHKEITPRISVIHSAF